MHWMGLCEFCGERAGWLQGSHGTCLKQMKKLKPELEELVREGTLAGKTHSELDEETRQRIGNLRPETFRESLIQGANDAATELSLKTSLSEAELARLREILEGFGIQDLQSIWAMRQWYGLATAELSYSIWLVRNGKLPSFEIQDPYRFSMRANERPIVMTPNVVLAEGGASGGGKFNVNIPIVTGISYNLDIPTAIGGNKSGFSKVDQGSVLITDRSIYFGGDRRNLRILLEDVVRYESFKDAYGVYASGEPPRIFIPDYSGMDTGWFFYNLLTSLSARLG